MKLKLMLAVAVAFFGLSLASCSGYDLKTCEKLVDKIKDDNLKNEDYAAMVDQLDGLLSYCESQMETISNIDSKTDRCDKWEDFKDSDEAEYCGGFYAKLEYAKENGDLKGEAKDAFKSIDAKSRFKKIVRQIDKLNKKCKDRD